jgi:cell division protein FtsN
VNAHAALLALSCAALAVALIAVGLVVWLILATRSARGMAHRHLRTGDRRQQDSGPPAGQPERRHRDPDDTRARRRDLDDPQWRVEAVDAPHVRPEDPATYPPRPVPRHRDPDEPATVEHAPPTADMRTLPPPGSIPR